MAVLNLPHTTSKVPNDYGSDNPCFPCLSETELFAIGAAILARANHYSLPDDLGTLLSASACWDCMSDKQQLEALLGELKATYADAVSLDTLRDEAKCLPCLEPKKIRSMILWLLAALFGTSRGQ